MGNRSMTSVEVAKVNKTQRDATFDVARGLAIIGIVLTHVLRGLNAGHLLGNGAWIPVTDRVLCLWHLSIFAFVGGIFVASSVRKRSMRTYLLERTFHFLSVYLLWTAVQGTVLLWAARLVNNPGSVRSLFRVWAPTGQLWYLPYLVLVTVVFVPLWRWRPAPWVFGVSAALSVAFWGIDGGVIGTQGLGLVVFFVAGIFFGVDRLRSALQSVPVMVAGVGGVVLFAVGAVVGVYGVPTPPTTGWADRTVASVALGVVLSVAMSAAVLLFARAARSWGFVALCGRRSLDIYLAHIILAAGCRIVLVKLGLHSVVLLAAVGLTVGVVGSLVVATALRRVGLAWVFDGPKLPARLRDGRGSSDPDTGDAETSKSPGSPESCRRTTGDIQSEAGAEQPAAAPQ
jgi:fucose 4-O-acetylase-like acetyltransferase